MTMKIHANTPVSIDSYDAPIASIAKYVDGYAIDSKDAYEAARLCLADSLGCAILSLGFPACTKLLGPVVPGTVVPHGSHVPGTGYVLDPIRGAFNFGTMVRWLDFNDTFLAAEWGHPSDNLGGLLAVADHLSRKARAEGKDPIKVKNLLTAMIKAHEIQGGMALLNGFNRVGLDHVILVKLATTAVATQMLGGSLKQIADAVSNVWIDTGSLRAYRHFPNAGSRKSWAAGDATSRGVFLAMITMQGEMGYPTALTVPRWGFYDAIFRGKPFEFQRPFGSYVMENVLFKVSFPAEFHAQTAVECAIDLHPEVKDRIDQIAKIEIDSHESAVRIIDKKGPLKNPADRDHCIQYMVAIGLLKGNLTADDYEDEAASDPRIDRLREKTEVKEIPSYSKDYLDPDKRSIANTVTVYFADGSKITRTVEYPIGHRRRRKEAIPLLFEKFKNNLQTYYPKKHAEELCALFQDHERLCDMDVDALVDLFPKPTKGTQDPSARK